jgi:hypothetical protein
MDVSAALHLAPPAMQRNKKKKTSTIPGTWGVECQRTDILAKQYNGLTSLQFGFFVCM